MRPCPPHRRRPRRPRVRRPRARRRPLAAQTYPRGDDPPTTSGRACTTPARPRRDAPPLARRQARALRLGARPDLRELRPGVPGTWSTRATSPGFSIWDVSDPARPAQLSVVECITSQGDPSIVGNLLFLSAEGGGNRKDCAKGGVENPADHMAGVRIYDVANPRAPRLVKNVETCKGSHTHTVVPHPTDRASSTSTSRAARARARDRSSPAAATAPTRPTRPTRSTGSTSSRCRWRGRRTRGGHGRAHLHRARPAPARGGGTRAPRALRAPTAR
jgi:hypothetical protein